MENIPSLEGKQEFVDLIKVFSLSAQIELLQLVNNLRLVAEIVVIPNFKDKMEPAIRELKDRGFFVVDKEHDQGIVDHFVSTSPSLAQEALDILNHRDGNSMDHRRFGELMGFPPGSIEAFVEGNQNDYLSDDEIEEALGFENHFFQAKLSRSNFDESIKHLKDSYRVLLEQAPHILEQGLPPGEDAEKYKEKVARFLSS